MQLVEKNGKRGNRGEAYDTNRQYGEENVQIGMEATDEKRKIQ